MNKNTFILQAPKLKSVCKSSISGFAFILFFLAGSFYSSGLANYFDNETHEAESYCYKLVQYKRGTFLLSAGSAVFRHLEIPNGKNRLLNSDHNSSSGQNTFSFIYSEELSVEEIDSLDDREILNVVLSKVSEDIHTSRTSSASFDKLPIQNIILSGLQTVVLLN